MAEAEYDKDDEIVVTGDRPNELTINGGGRSRGKGTQEH